ncbi:MAG: hypothetical protein K6E59_00795 [Bacilli bacterium]|nr:hypothetical protein [Bacilli bacterium]
MKPLVRKSALVFPLLSLTACSGNGYFASSREEIASQLGDASTHLVEAFEGLEAFSAKSVSYEEDNPVTVCLSWDKDGQFYLETTTAEESHTLCFGIFVKGEEEEEEEFLAYFENEEGELEEVEEENIEGYRELTLSYVATMSAFGASKVAQGLAVLDSLDGYEEAVKAQYEEGDYEVEEGDLYLDLMGERYFLSESSFGFGVSYAYGNVASIEEDDEGELIITLDEDSVEGAFALTMEDFGTGYLPSFYADGEGQRFESSPTFDFASPFEEE